MRSFSRHETLGRHSEDDILSDKLKRRLGKGAVLVTLSSSMVAIANPDAMRSAVVHASEYVSSVFTEHDQCSMSLGTNVSGNLRHLGDEGSFIVHVGRAQYLSSHVVVEVNTFSAESPNRSFGGQPDHASGEIPLEDDSIVSVPYNESSNIDAIVLERSGSEITVSCSRPESP